MHPIVSSIRRIAAADGAGPGAAILVSVAHGATHWINATFYVVLPFIAAELGLSYTQTGTLVTVFHATAVLVNLGSGPVVDISGRFVGFQVASLAVGGLALVVLGFADAALSVAAAVVLIGISISMWHPAAITYLSRRYPSTRGFALSIHTVGASLGDTIAPPVAGLLLQVLTWQTTSMVSAAPLFAMAVIVMFALKGTARPVGERGGGSGSGAYLQALRILLRDRVVLKLWLLAGIWSMAQGGAQLFVPLYLVGELHAGPAAVGIALMALQVGAIVAGPVAGAWSDRVGRRPVVLAALTAGAVFLGVITVFDGVVPFVVTVSLVGCALFAIRPVIHSWMMDRTADKTSGSAVSLLFAAQSGLNMIVPVAGGIIADVWGLTVVFYALTVVCAGAALLAAVMPNSPAGRTVAGRAA